MNQFVTTIAAFAIFGLFFSILPQAYSQTSDVEISEQTTLSGKLLENPLAQEILKKIEESKRKIAQLEKQNFENLKAQKFLEERRAVALDLLNKDLREWEEKWYEFSPEVAYQKFVDKKPTSVHGIYLKQFNFTQEKHQLGIQAKTQALDTGMASPDALNEFNEAAKSTVQEYTDYNEEIQPDSPEQIETKIKIIEGEADSLNNNYFYRSLTIKGDLNAKYLKELQNERNELKQLTRDFASQTGLTSEEFIKQTTTIREKYAPLKEQILKENAKTLLEFEERHMMRVNSILDEIKNNEKISLLIEGKWNPETSKIEIIRK
jgi:hypothetical protein